MKKTTCVFASLFASSIFALGIASPANAEGNCAFGHGDKTAQSSALEVAQTKPLQTPKPVSN